MPPLQSSAEVANYVLTIAALSLLLFGLLFNWTIELVQARRKFIDYTWLFVVIGVGITIAASGFVIGWQDAGRVALLFGASGLPMVLGAIVRHERQRQEQEARLLAEEQRARQAAATREQGEGAGGAR